MSDAEYPQTEQLIALFNQTFKPLNTVLVRGQVEPIYYPACAEKPAQIVFAHGYFASALHEIAHWCLAGEDRRKLEDYGYWYCPDGRSAEQQAEFEKVEIKPQAIEWALTVAAGRCFKVSTDNLNGVEPNRIDFQTKVHAQVCRYLAVGFPARAHQFIGVLQQHYQLPALRLTDFDWRDS
ncbi:elongation factor P hydroxylase [Echinimonas agarilytica]|uniref:Elongation factor P hydroxylase n=1 Tax=Echinimonas agarilytica TaxID=1215918 RepID=A0AA41W5N3_9GAMM|nr:elongation factor P hydroxylase [Echinimonas agarilytica]MCM2679236.1 elongation factor P hydroxylase [Echinimonas agarilytica]